MLLLCYVYIKIIGLNSALDIVDIKPANMEELTEVITAAEFHPLECNIFAYSSSKGTVRLCDMRKAALCDRHSKCKLRRDHTVVIKIILLDLILFLEAIDYHANIKIPC